MECLTIKVHIDQFNTTNSGDKVFTIPLIRKRGELGSSVSLIIGEGFHHLPVFQPKHEGWNSSTLRATCYGVKRICTDLTGGVSYGSLLVNIRRYISRLLPRWLLLMMLW